MNKKSTINATLKREGIDEIVVGFVFVWLLGKVALSKTECCRCPQSTSLPDAADVSESAFCKTVFIVGESVHCMHYASL